MRDNPDLKLIVLGKHGLIVWGETAEEAYRKTIEVINQAVDVRQRAHGRRLALRRAQAASRRVAEALLPAIRGAVSSEKSKVLTVDTSDRVLEFVCSEQARELVTVGAPCPDHLVHTKRLPLWVSREDATPERIAELADAYRADYRAYFEAHAGEGDVPGDPDPRIVLVEGMGLVATGTTTKAAKISRDLYHRAIEVMAGAQALGEFVSLDAAESFAIEYWPLELYKLAQAPPPGELQGKVALVTGGAGGIGRAIIATLASAGACVVAFDLDGDGAGEAVAEYGDRGLAVAGDVTSEDGRRGRLRRGGRAFGGVDIVVSNAGIASSASIEETTLAEWNRNHAILGTGYFLVGREAFRCSSSRTRAARSSSSPPRTRSWRARTPPPTRRRRRPSCTSRAAWPRRAAATASGSTPSTRTPSCGARRSGARRGARSARRRTTSSPTSSTSTTASATR